MSYIHYKYHTEVTRWSWTSGQCTNLIYSLVHGQLDIQFHLICCGPFGRERETSWANARVKLHSPVHFQSKKILGPKKCWVQKSFDSKKSFGSKNILGPKILDPKILSQKNLGFDSTNSNFTCPVVT